MEEKVHYIGEHFLSLHQLSSIVAQKKKLVLSKKARKRIVDCRTYLEQKIEQAQEPIYGINTGFGSLCNTEISKGDLKQLQLNLVRSHACGMGAEIPPEIVKIMLLLKIRGLSYGHSGVQLKTVERLIDFYNHDALPVIFKQGSLGASGDLAPLAHLSLPLLGEGEVNYGGERISAGELNEKMNWEPIVLESKEGLALLNGTQFMSAYAAHLLIRLSHLFKWANFAAAASIEAAVAKLDSFAHSIQMIRPHPGQIEVASQIRTILEGSKVMQQKKYDVQDPYCLRCIPQVHGASLDTINHARSVVEVEMNSVTDNPTVFETEDEIISAGNFHGQPLALVLDFLAIKRHARPTCVFKSPSRFKFRLYDCAICCRLHGQSK